MGKYTNPVNITSGRRLHTAQPIDDRVIFQNLLDVQQDIQLGRTTSWYNGMVAFIHETNAFYVWRLSNNPNNQNYPNELNPNVQVNYNGALLPSDYMYSLGYPDADYAGYYFNWYPVGDSDNLYVNDQPTTATNLEGFPVGTIPGITTFKQLWDNLLYPYMPPLISLSSSPNSGYYEKGVVIDNITLLANIVKKKDDITEVSFYRNNVLVSTENNPNPEGGNVQYIDTVDVGSGINPQDVSFKAVVYDDTQYVTSNQVDYNFVYPIYVGNLETTNPTENQIKSLTKLLIPKQNVSFQHNFNQSRYVIAYPQNYGAISSILDNNNYETIDDFTIISKQFLMLDGAQITYSIYVFNVSGYPDALTDAVNFTNTYKF